MSSHGFHLLRRSVEQIVLSALNNFEQGLSNCCYKISLRVMSGLVVGDHHHINVEVLVHEEVLLLGVAYVESNIKAILRDVAGLNELFQRSEVCNLRKRGGFVVGKHFKFVSCVDYNQRDHYQSDDGSEVRFVLTTESG